MGEPAGLAEEQLRALGRLSRLPVLDSFYLAGGSAIAFHLGHRRSLDLDLFSARGDVELDRVKQALLGLGDDVAVIAETDAIVKVQLFGEPVDFVRYPYPPLEPPEAGPAGFKVAGLRDLIVMKLVAVARRGIRRDFWDVQAVLEAGITLREAGNAYVRRFGRSQSDLYHVARALTYFADAEKDPTFPLGMTPQRWEQIKDYFTREAPALLFAES